MIASKRAVTDHRDRTGPSDNGGPKAAVFFRTMDDTGPGATVYGRECAGIRHIADDITGASATDDGFALATRFPRQLKVQLDPEGQFPASEKVQVEPTQSAKEGDVLRM